jgi:hypothetical protein
VRLARKKVDGEEAEQAAPSQEKPKRKRGNRPGENQRAGLYKFDTKKKAAYLKLLEAGGRRHASARSIKIHPSTVALHMKSDPEFANQVFWAEMEADDEVEDALRMAAISGNVTAAFGWLYSRRPERWSDTRHVKFDSEAFAKDIIKKCKDIGVDPWTDPVLAAVLAAGGLAPSPPVGGDEARGRTATEASGGGSGSTPAPDDGPAPGGQPAPSPIVP